MISSEAAPSCSPDCWLPGQHTPPSTGRFHAGCTQHCPPARPQLSVRFWRRKPHWPRKVNAHSKLLHSIPNRIQCKDSGAASRDCICWPLARAGLQGWGRAVPTCSAMAVTVRRLAAHTAHEKGFQSCVFNMKHFIW